MGASVSNISKEIKHKTKNIIEFEGTKNQCIINQDGIRLSGLKGVKFGLIKITQKCTVSSKTYYKALIKTLTDLSMDLDNETKAALGIAVGNVATSIENKVENLMKLKCGGNMFTSNVGAIEILDTEDSEFEGIIIEQEGALSGECTIDQLIDEISTIVDKTVNKTTGSSLADLLFGDVGAIILIIGGLLLAGLVVKTQLGKKKKDSESSTKSHSGGSKYANYTSSWI